jgi:cysteine desulfurase / selenocysteine lyase
MATAATARQASTLNVKAIREDFPILKQRIHGKPLVYLDNSATTQKPTHVLDALQRYYFEQNANVHRGVHTLSGRATDLYDAARVTAQRFLNAADPREIVYVRGTTEAINLVAQTWGRVNISKDDEIVLTEMEHHSNIVPWQILAQEKGAKIRAIPVSEKGELELDGLEKLLNAKTKIIALAHVSNVLGTVNPVADVVKIAKKRGITVLIDGAQAVAHEAVDVQAIGCDFYAFSAHKIFGPTGIGVLYGRAELLEKMPVYQGGGGMIGRVSFGGTTYADLPYKYEAGTPNIAGAIGMGAALEYVMNIGLDRIAAYEQELLAYATQQLSKVPGLRLTGTAAHKAAVMSFVLDDVHPHDIGTILDREGVAIRAGHHCCQPLMGRLGVPATARASFAIYNTREEVDVLVKALGTVHEVFA